MCPGMLSQVIAPAELLFTYWAHERLFAGMDRTDMPFEVFTPLEGLAARRTHERLANS